MVPAPGPVVSAPRLVWGWPFARWVSAAVVVVGDFFLFLRKAVIAPPAAVSVAKPTGFFQRLDRG